MERISMAVKAVCFVSAGICLTDSIFAGTKLRGQLRMMLHLILALALISPFVSGGLELELPEINSFDLADSGYSVDIYRDELARQTKENIEAALTQQLAASGIIAEKISAEVNISEDMSISITKVTVTAEDFAGAAGIIQNCLGSETEVVNGAA